MKNSAGRIIIVLIATIGSFAVAACADVTVSVTLSGNLEDMLPVIQHLKDMGIGLGKGAAAPGEAIKMEVHSVAPAPPGAPAAPTAPAAPGATPTPPPPAPKPALTLGAPSVNPASPKAGAKALIAAPVVDPDHKIDSITVQIPELNKLSIDLFDNGTHGDVAAHDGTWSGEINLPGDMAAGDYTLQAFAFNANGEPILTAGKDGAASRLTAQTKVSVTK